MNMAIAKLVQSSFIDLEIEYSQMIAAISNTIPAFALLNIRCVSAIVNHFLEVIMTLDIKYFLKV